MSKNYDVILIGGGIMGCSSAFELAKRGLAVAVVEKGTVGAGPTGESSAILRTHYSNELTARMANYGLGFYREFAEHTGDDCGFHQTGFLLLVESPDNRGLESNLSLQRRIGIRSERLDAADIEELMPGLDLGPEAGSMAAAWEPESGYADAYLAVTGLARAAKRLGVEIYQDTEVTGLRFVGDRIAGVDTSLGPLNAPRVVNAAGAWGARVAAMAGLEAPIRACRVQVALFRRPDEAKDGHPVVADFANACYFRPEIGNLTLSGLIDPKEAEAIVDPDDYAKKIDFRFQAEVGSRLSRRYPVMERSASEGGYASLYAVTPDWHPILDQVPADSGFFLCSGFSGHGFKLAPAVGVLMADMVTGQVTSRLAGAEVDPSLFRLARYRDQSPVAGGYDYHIVG